MIKKDYRVCSVCGMLFFYFDSPTATKCFCGGALREPTKEEETDIINNQVSINSATVSC